MAEAMPRARAVRAAVFIPAKESLKSFSPASCPLFSPPVGYLKSESPTFLKPVRGLEAAASGQGSCFSKGRWGVMWVHALPDAE